MSNLMRPVGGKLWGAALLLAGTAHAADVQLCGIGTDNAAWVKGLAQVAGTGNALRVGCATTLSLGTDPTKAIFIASNTHIVFDPGGSLQVDNVQFPAWTIVNQSNVTIDNLTVIYAGNYGDVTDDHPISGIYNDQTLKNYMRAHGAVFPAGKGPYYVGPTNASAFLALRGATSGVAVRGCSMTAKGTNAANFMPVVFALGFDYTSNGKMAEPTGNTFSDCVFDGVYMGFTGTALDTTINNLKELRYSVMQSSNGTNERGVPGNTWFSPPHLIYLRSGPGFPSSAKLINVDDCHSTYVGNPHRGIGGGVLASLKIETNGADVSNYCSNRPDGIADLITLGNTAPGSITNLSGTYDSSITATDGGHNFGVRWPGGSGSYNNLTMSHIVITDVNPSAVQTPFLGANQSTNSNLTISDLTVRTAYAGGGPEFGGKNVSVQGQYFIKGCTMPPAAAILKKLANVQTTLAVNCE